MVDLPEDRVEQLEKLVSTLRHDVRGIVTPVALATYHLYKSGDPAIQHSAARIDQDGRTAGLAAEFNIRTGAAKLRPRTTRASITQLAKQRRRCHMRQGGCCRVRLAVRHKRGRL